MTCPLCGLGRRVKVAAEMTFYFSSLGNLRNPEPWVSPKVWVCLDCGYSWFIAPESELALLATYAPISEGEALPVPMLVVAT